MSMYEIKKEEKILKKKFESTRINLTNPRLATWDSNKKKRPGEKDQS